MPGLAARAVDVAERVGAGRGVVAEVGGEERGGEVREEEGEDGGLEGRGLRGEAVGEAEDAVDERVGGQGGGGGDAGFEGRGEGDGCEGEGVLEVVSGSLVVRRRGVAYVVDVAPGAAAVACAG